MEKHWENQPRAPKGTEIGGQWVAAARQAAGVRPAFMYADEVEDILHPEELVGEVGTMVPKDMWPVKGPDQTVEEFVEELESYMRTLEREQLYIIDPDTGEVEGYYMGDASSVPMGPHEIKNITNRIVTHNHPPLPDGRYGTLSHPDIKTAYTHSPAEMRVVTPGYTDVLSGFRRSTFSQYFYEVYDDKTARKAAARLGISAEDAWRDFAGIVWDPFKRRDARREEAYMETIADNLGMTFRREWAWED
jgi:hypothetical protein